jgi:hypothetical protein
MRHADVFRLSSINGKCGCDATEEYALRASTRFALLAIKAVAVGSGKWNDDMVTDLEDLD